MNRMHFREREREREMITMMIEQILLTSIHLNLIVPLLTSMLRFRIFHPHVFLFPFVISNNKHKKKKRCLHLHRKAFYVLKLVQCLNRIHVKIVTICSQLKGENIPLNKTKTHYYFFYFHFYEK